MSFVDRFFEQLAARANDPLVAEVHGTETRPVTGGELAQKVARARGTLRASGVKPADRVVLLAPNSIRWVAADLAALAEGAVVVPMYARQDPHELVEMMHDCEPTLVMVGSAELADAVRAHWPEAPLVDFDALFAGESVDEALHARDAADIVTIIYTSGTSGAPKGVMYSTSNVDFMLPTTGSALERMMGASEPDHRVFHYLPFCFAGSRVVLWTCLFRGNRIDVSTDLDNLAVELATAGPNYVLNVPMLLERIKGGVEKSLRDKPALVQALYDRALKAHAQKVAGHAGRRDRLVLRLAERILFQAIRAKIGPNLRCLICGSAPLAEGTQRWFEMLGIVVYQVYGLTETTAIVTMDRPPEVRPGRVGPLLDGVEARIGDGEEMLVRGPNIFAGYWRKPEATEAAFLDGWFRTGDRAEQDADGNWAIIGRAKNLVVLTSGHNVPPEPIEQSLLGIEGVEQAVVVGHGRPFLATIVAGDAPQEAIDAGLAHINEGLPHYRRVRRVIRAPEVFTPENGLLTANRKLRRQAIETAFAAEIEALYAS